MKPLEIKVETADKTVTFEEIERIIAHAKREHPASKLRVITISDDTVDLAYDNQRFSRTHRITGYLVGDDDRWNDAKREELADRLKHDIF